MVKTPRIFLTGASCSGVSTLGAALGMRFGVPMLDVDDFFWMPTDPPYTIIRVMKDRLSLIRQAQEKARGWVLAGDFGDWGDTLIEDVDLIVIVRTPRVVRLARLDRREATRHGARIRPGGDMHASHMAFRDWAAGYDDPSFTGRSLAGHEHWLSVQSRPVLRLDGTRPVKDLSQRVAEALGRG